MSIPHPKKFKMSGVYFEVFAECNLTDVQAEKIVRLYCKTYKLKKKDQGRIIKIHTHYDAGSIEML